MRGCGTQFIDEPGGLSDYEIGVLNQLELVAMKHEGIAKQLKSVVHKCKSNQSIEGIDEMVAFSFNSQQYTPNYGGGGGGLPPGQYKGVIVNSEAVTTTDQVTKAVKGGYMAFHLTPIEGPLAGQVQIDRLNLHHTNPKVVEIANEQLSAYCHVLGKFAFNDTAELHNIPFIFEVGFQKGQEPSQEKPNGGYTEVKKILDVNGNEPGKAGSGPAPAAAPAQAPAMPPAGVAATGAPPQGAWGGAPAGQPAPQGQPAPAAGAWGGQPGQPAPAPAGAPPQGAWGGQPAAGAPAPQPGAPGPWGGPPAA